MYLAKTFNVPAKTVYVPGKMNSFLAQTVMGNFQDATKAVHEKQYMYLAKTVNVADKNSLCAWQKQGMYTAEPVMGDLQDAAEGGPPLPPSDRGRYQVRQMIFLGGGRIGEVVLRGGFWV